MNQIDSDVFDKLNSACLRFVDCGSGFPASRQQLTLQQQ
jgi:hypothetical protein